MAINKDIDRNMDLFGVAIYEFGERRVLFNEYNGIDTKLQQ